VPTTPPRGPASRLDVRDEGLEIAEPVEASMNALQVGFGILVDEDTPETGDTVMPETSRGDPASVRAARRRRAAGPLARADPPATHAGSASGKMKAQRGAVAGAVSQLTGVPRLPGIAWFAQIRQSAYIMPVHRTKRAGHAPSMGRRRSPAGTSPGRQAVPALPQRATAPRTVPATEAARRFAALVDEVRRTGRSVLVTQHGRPVCRIAPPPPPESTVESLIEALVSGPRVDSEFLETVESITRAQPRAPRSPWDE
jgi:prevent-host-death family protein